MLGEIILSVHKSLSVILCLLILPTVTPNVLGKELSAVTTADSYTKSDDPDVNHGGVSILYSYNYELELFNQITTYEYHIWLKFDLSEIPSEATMNSIILRMHTSIIGTLATNKVGVFLCSNSTWQEMTVTWNNCPETTGQPIDTVYVGTDDEDYDFDVTSAVKGKNVVTLVLKTLEPTELIGWAAFDSRETYDDKDRPRLIVEYTTPSQPQDTDPPQPVNTVPFYWFLVVSVVVIAIVVIVSLIIAAYALTRKKKQVSPSTTPPTPSLTPSFFLK